MRLYSLPTPPPKGPFSVLMGKKPSGSQLIFWAVACHFLLLFPRSVFADIITASFASLFTSARFQVSLFKTKQTKLSQPPASSALLPLNTAQSKQPWHRSLHLLRTQPPKPDCPALPGEVRPCPRPHCPVIFIPFLSLPCLGSCPDLPFCGQ